MYKCHHIILEHLYHPKENTVHICSYSTFLTSPAPGFCLAWVLQLEKAFDLSEDCLHIFFLNPLYYGFLFLWTQFYSIWDNPHLEAAEGHRPHTSQAWPCLDAKVLGQANEVATVLLKDLWCDFKSSLYLREVETLKDFLSVP